MKFCWNIFIVEFTKKKKKHTIPFSEHVFTSHWILNVWLVIGFWLIQFCFTTTTIAATRKYGKLWENPETAIFFLIFLFIYLFIFFQIVELWGRLNGEREKRNKSPARCEWKERQQILSSVTSVGFFRHCGVRSGPNARGLSRSVFFLYLFFFSKNFFSSR